MAKVVRLLSEPFNPGQFVGPFTDAHPGLGGVCTFVGEVRSDADVEALELSHLDYEEFLAAFESMNVSLASHLRELGSYREAN